MCCSWRTANWHGRGSAATADKLYWHTHINNVQLSLHNAATYTALAGESKSYGTTNVTGQNVVINIYIFKNALEKYFVLTLS